MGYPSKSNRPKIKHSFKKSRMNKKEKKRLNHLKLVQDQEKDWQPADLNSTKGKTFRPDTVKKNET